MSAHPADNDVALSSLEELLRRITLADSTDEIAAAWQAGCQRALGIEYEILISLFATPPGSYRVIRHGPTARPEEFQLPPGLISNDDELRTFPIFSGGLLGQLIADDRPKTVNGIHLDADPILGSVVAEYRSAVVAPVRFRSSTSWFIGLMRGQSDATEVTLRNQMVIHVLRARSLSAQNWTRWARLERDVYGQELEQLGEVQRSLLPKIPDVQGTEIAASYETCTQAGGDFYDFLALPDGRIAIVIADVSGHGAAAAMGMVMLHATLHAYDGDPFAPAAVLDWTDRRVSACLGEGSFITAFLGVLDPETGRLTYAIAGHCPPRLRLANGAIEILDRAGSLPLGIAGQYSGGEADTYLHEGDALFLYTDGITEARSPCGQEFSEIGLDSALQDCESSARAYVDRVVGAVSAHTQNIKRDDDQTIIVVRRVGVRQA
jgi:sigma-B regulation protein RsbU (phosphoserine phosphatase)